MSAVIFSAYAGGNPPGPPSRQAGFNSSDTGWSLATLGL